MSWSTDTVPHGLLLRGEKPVSVGVSAVDPARYGIAQMDGTNGDPDPAFGATGQKFWAASSRPATDFPETSGSILLPSGAIATNFRLGTGFAVASIEPDGNSLSGSFGSGGMVTITTNGRPTDLVRQPDGKLLVSLVDSAAGTGADVRRLEASGTSDGNFGKAGVFSDSRFRSKRVGIQTDGRIIVMGDSAVTGNINVVRLWN